MSKFWNHFVSNGAESPDPQPPEPEPGEAEALDAFSRVVVRVAEVLRDDRRLERWVVPNDYPETDPA